MAECERTLSRSTSSWRWADHDVGGEQHGAGAQGRQPVALAFDEPGDAATELIPCLPDPDELLCDVGNYPLRGVGGR